jgi:hypothetical protein
MDEKGGLVPGSEETSHENGGKDYKVDGQPSKIAELEGDEAVIVPEAFDQKCFSDSQGKQHCNYKMTGTISQIASAINVLGGGKNFDPGAKVYRNGILQKTPHVIDQNKYKSDGSIESGSVVINKTNMRNPEVMTFKGTAKEIASQINSYEGNGVQILKEGGQVKFDKVMKEFSEGKLKSGSTGKVVTDRDQALAIAYSESGMDKYKEGGSVQDMKQLNSFDWNKILWDIRERKKCLLDPLTNFQREFVASLDAIKDDCISMGGFYYDSNPTNYAYNSKGEIVLFDIEDWYYTEHGGLDKFLSENEDVKRIYENVDPISVLPWDDPDYTLISLGEASMGAVYLNTKDGSVLKITGSPYEAIGTTRIWLEQQKNPDYTENFAKIFSVQNIGKYSNMRGVSMPSWKGDWYLIKREDVWPFGETEQKLRIDNGLLSKTR